MQVPIYDHSLALAGLSYPDSKSPICNELLRPSQGLPLPGEADEEEVEDLLAHPVSPVPDSSMATAAQLLEMISGLASGISNLTAQVTALTATVNQMAQATPGHLSSSDTKATVQKPSGYDGKTGPDARRFIAAFNNPLATPAQVEEASHNVVLPFRSVPVFHRIKFINPKFYGSETLDSIHAYPRLVKNGKVTRVSRFDTVLIRVREPWGNGHKFDGTSLIHVRG